MSDLDRRLRKLERPAGRGDAYEVIFCEPGESLESAWERQNPGQPLPKVPIAVLEGGGPQEPSPEEWSVWARKG